MALLVMTIHPLVPSGKVILDEMLEAHKEHSPKFF